MIKSLSIENYQSHEQSTLEFVDGVNVIIGPSDAGKSAIFRAFTWVVTNRPLGDAFRSEWGGLTKVEVVTSESCRVIRYKGDTSNEYVVEAPNGESMLLRAFGSDVPEEVSRVFMLDDVNIQSQTDLPFLLSASAGEVAQMLNKAASIDDIDLSMSNLRKVYSSTKRELEYDSVELNKYREVLKSYDELDSQERKLSEIQSLHNQYSMIQRQYDQLSELVKEIKNVEVVIGKQKDVGKLERKLNELDRLCGEVLSTNRDFDELMGLVKEIQSLSNKLQSCQNRITKLEEQYASLVPDVCPLCGNPMRG